MFYEILVLILLLVFPLFSRTCPFILQNVNQIVVKNPETLCHRYKLCEVHLLVGGVYQHQITATEFLFFANGNLNRHLG